MSPKADSEEIQSDAAAKKPVASLRVLLFIKWKLVFLLTNCPRYYLDCVVCQTFFVAFFARLLDIAPPSGAGSLGRSSIPDLWKPGRRPFNRNNMDVPDESECRRRRR